MAAQMQRKLDHLEERNAAFESRFLNECESLATLALFTQIVAELKQSHDEQKACHVAAWAPLLADFDCTDPQGTAASAPHGARDGRPWQASTHGAERALEPIAESPLESRPDTQEEDSTRSGDADSVRTGYETTAVSAAATNDSTANMSMPSTSPPPPKPAPSPVELAAAQQSQHTVGRLGGSAATSVSVPAPSRPLDQPQRPAPTTTTTASASSTVDERPVPFPSLDSTPSPAPCVPSSTTSFTIITAADRTVGAPATQPKRPAQARPEPPLRKPSESLQRQEPRLASPFVRQAAAHVLSSAGVSANDQARRRPSPQHHATQFDANDQARRHPSPQHHATQVDANDQASRHQSPQHHATQFGAKLKQPSFRGQLDGPPPTCGLSSNASKAGDTAAWPSSDASSDSGLCLSQASLSPEVFSSPAYQSQELGQYRHFDEPRGDVSSHHTSFAPMETNDHHDHDSAFGARFLANQQHNGTGFDAFQSGGFGRESPGGAPKEAFHDSGFSSSGPIQSSTPRAAQRMF